MYNNPNVQVITLPLVNNQINPYAPVVYTVSPQSDVRHSYKPQANRPRGKRASWHLRSFIATCILYLGMAIVIDNSRRNPDTPSSTSGGIFFGIYLLYLIVAICNNKLFKYLKNIEHGQQFKNQYRRIQCLAGHFVFTVVSYHYQQTVTTTKITDQYGHTRYEYETRTQKVETHRYREQFYPALTEDMSGGVQTLKTTTDMIFVHYLIDYRFADAVSRSNFDYAWYQFKRIHRRDTHNDYDYWYTTPGLVQRKCFYVGEKRPLSFVFLVIFTLLGLVWPYSLFMERKINRFKIWFMKVLTIQG